MGYENDPKLQAWERRVQRDLVPKIKGSGSVVSLVPDGETDVKFAVELGLSIMLDKPIIAVVRPGTQVPDKLVRVADRIVEGDLSTEAAQASLMQAIQDTMKELDQ